MSGTPESDPGPGGPGNGRPLSDPSIRIEKLGASLPNRTGNLLIQWIRQNGFRMPERRKNAVELFPLKPGQLARIEAIVAECFERGVRDQGPPAS